MTARITGEAVVRFRAVLAVVFVLAACASVRYLTSDLRPLLPPSWYRVAWAEVEACAGEHGRGVGFEDIRWYTSRYIIELRKDRAQELAGQWRFPHTIILSQDYVRDDNVVRHEMLHGIMGTAFNHGDPEFDRCDPLR